MERFIEQDIDKLLNNESIHTSKPAVIDQPHDLIESEIDRFQVETKQFCEEIQDCAQYMQRSYLMLEDKCTYNLQNNTQKHVTVVSTVFIGEKDLVEIMIEDS